MSNKTTNDSPVLTEYTVTLDDLVAFAQMGWHYRLNDGETRDDIAKWLERRGNRSVPQDRLGDVTSEDT